MTTRPLLLLLFAALATLPGCADDNRTTSPYLSCDRCGSSTLEAGDELGFEASWLGRAWRDGGFGSEGTWETCDPIRVEIACVGASCETTRRSPTGSFWSLEQALAVEADVDDGGTSCMIGLPETFAVRPTTGGALTVAVTLVNLSTEESVHQEYGPFTVTGPTIAPDASCPDCDVHGRVALGTPYSLRARWDGVAGDSDPIGRQPFVLTLDCGDVPCEARLGSSLDPDDPPWAPPEPWLVDAAPARRGIAVQVRAAEPGTMRLTALLEHTVTHEAAVFDLGTSSHHRVDALQVLCLGGELCGYAPEFSLAAEFGVVGLDGPTQVFVDADVRFASDVSPEPQATSCSPAPHIAPDGAQISACETRLYAVDGATEFTLFADWNGLDAALTAPGP